MSRTDDRTGGGVASLDATLASVGPTLHAPADATLLAADAPIRPAAALDIERGALVGRYVVLTRLGAGGMGVVYAGYDPELDRKVALKLLHASGPGEGPEGTAAEIRRTRLLREAQALAKLSHPHVVAIHDVGTLGDRVWLAMEYVDGLTLGSWLEEHRRSWREILEIMTAVGRGLAAAHAAGLVHRDLKPDNIMVGRDGRVRVMDFGLARASGPREPGPAADALMLTSLDRAALSVQVTQAGAIMGTPAYMAPEQWRGESVDAAADQFAFCVTLWEALFGARPYDGDTVVALVGALTRGQIRPPPRRAGVPAWLRRALLRGLLPDPQRRYPSMDALLAALARGRARARRVRVALGLGAAALLAAAVPLWQRHDRAARLAACDQTGFALAEVWNDDARAALGAALRTSGVAYAETTVTRTLPWLDRFAAAWADARVQVCRAADVESTLAPELHARALACLDERREELAALLATLREDPETAVLRAVIAAADLTAPGPCADPDALARQPAPPADPDARARVAELRREMIRIDGLSAAGRYVEALGRAEALLAAAEQVGHVPLLAEVSVQYGGLARRAQQFERAEAALVRGFVDGGAIGADETAAGAALGLLTLKGTAQAKFEAGLDWARATEMLVRRLGRLDDIPGANYANELAVVYKRHGQYDRAQELLERALAIRERELGADHPEIALLLNNLANTLSARGDPDASIALYRRALATLEITFGPDHPYVGTILNNVGAILYNRGEHDEALALFERALAIRESVDGPDDPLVLDLIGNKALILIERGELAAAAALYRRVLAALEKLHDPNHLKIADALGNLARIMRGQLDFDGAEALERRALAIREAAFGPDNVELAHSLTPLGILAQRRGDLDRALDLHRRAVALREAALAPDSFELAESLYQLGDIHLDRGELAEAERRLVQALAIQEKAHAEGHVATAATRHALAHVRRRQGDLAAAEALEEQALATWQRHPSEAQSEALSLANLGAIALARGRPADALPWLERALARHPDAPALALSLAEVRFALARALADAPAGAGRDLARARRLATDAAQTFRAAGPRARASLAEVQTWLKRHPA